MNVEERRATIVKAALPLLIEQGATVRTSDIAAAAGIAEGTVFRAFHDKKALFLACVHAVFESRTEVETIERIDPNLPLAERLILAGNSVSDYQNRLWSVVMALRNSGIDVHQTGSRDCGRGEDVDPREGAPAAMMRIGSAIAALFDDDELRIAPNLAAQLLLGLLFSNRMQPEGFGAVAEVSEVVDLFLHGTLRAPTGGRNGDD